MGRRPDPGCRPFSYPENDGRDTLVEAVERSITGAGTADPMSDDRTERERPDGRREQGFSLLELLIVVALIGIIATIAILALQGALDKSKQRGTMMDMRSMASAIEVYRMDTGLYPANGLTINQLALILIPYETTVVRTQDHWNHAYRYTASADEYSIESFGKDGIDGPDIDFSTRFDFDRDIIVCNGLFRASPDS